LRSASSGQEIERVQVDKAAKPVRQTK